jgi:hypothetical protein
MSVGQHQVPVGDIAIVVPQSDDHKRQGCAYPRWDCRSSQRLSVFIHNQSDRARCCLVGGHHRATLLGVLIRAVLARSYDYGYSEYSTLLLRAERPSGGGAMGRYHRCCCALGRGPAPSPFPARGGSPPSRVRARPCSAARVSFAWKQAGQAVRRRGMKCGLAIRPGHGAYVAG